MLRNTRTRDARAGERGATLVTIAIALTFILGMAGMAIDLVALYVARSEAQRSADAAALAGATTFVTSGFTSGGVTQAVAQTLATDGAIAVGNQNLVGGQNPNVQSGDVTFDFSKPGDPQVTVVVQRTVARGNPMPMFFVKIFGITTADVSATATAEAYNPSGTTGGPTYCASCLKPFLIPNCDPAPRSTPANPLCPPPGGFYFVDPSTRTLENPGRFPTGVIGQTWVLHMEAAPSQWYAIAVGTDQSKSAWRATIAGCNAVLLTCGNTVQTLNGIAVGPAGQGIRDLINASGDGPNQGQDTITLNTDLSLPPFTITGGANNPNPAAVGKTIVQSSSIATIAIYDGNLLIPGGSTATIVGFMQVFIQYVSPPPGADITVTIMNVTGCGTGSGGSSCGSSGGGGGSGTGGTITGGGTSTIPVRLIRP